MITAMITQTIVIETRLETCRVLARPSPMVLARPVSHQPAEGDAGAEQENRAPVDPRGLVPVEGELAPAPVDREHEQQAGGQGRHHALVQPAVGQALVQRRVVAQEQADQPGQRPQGDGHAEGDQGVALARRQPAELALLLGDERLDPLDPLHLGTVQPEDDHEQGDEHDEHDRERHQEPLEEGDGLAGRLLDQGPADQVRGLPMGSSSPPTVMP
jgi:hypothetical protein